MKPGYKYNIKVLSKNCGYLSQGAVVTGFAASVPSTLDKAPTVASYINSTALLINWESVSHDGGKPLLKYKLYIDGVAHSTEASPDSNSLELAGLTLG